MTTTEMGVGEAGVIPPVRKSVVVKASVERAFEVFTADFDSWWPRSHHIGSQPMQRAVIETKAGGRCYSEQTDGSLCPWGQVLVWEPPRRFVMAWQVTPNWTYEPEVGRSSEVEVRFSAEPGGFTRVDLEHRHFERHGPEGGKMRTGVDSPNGWGDLLEMFRGRVEREG